ncbi:MAG TPA: hypothetical protein ACFCUC_10260 [Desulfobacterales bacterium]
MNRWRRPAVLMLILFFLTVSGTPSRAQDAAAEDGSGINYSFSYTPVYQFETDLDEGGNFDVNRHYLNFDAMHQINRDLRLGLGLNYGYEDWNFDDRTDIAGASLWSDLHRAGVSLPIFYRVGYDWSLGLTPTVEFSGESGADFSDSLIYGGGISATRSFGDNLFLGLGFGIFDELEETVFFPFIVIDWQISEQFRLANPYQAGPAGPAGLELICAPAETWELGIGGAYRSLRFRLDDGGAVPDGVVENEFFVGFLRVGKALGRSFSLDLSGGFLFNGELSIEDADGNGIGDEDYDPAPFAALTFSGEF